LIGVDAIQKNVRQHFKLANNAHALGRVAGRGDLLDPNSDGKYPMIDSDGNLMDYGQVDVNPAYYYFNSKQYDRDSQGFDDKCESGGICRWYMYQGSGNLFCDQKGVLKTTAQSVVGPCY
jgi:hypothetical protein